MQVTVGKIAEILGGTVNGNSEELIDRPSKIEAASKGSISFVAQDKYIPFVHSSNASAYIVSKELDISVFSEKTFVIVDDVYASIAILLETYNASSEINEVSEKAEIHPSATIGENVSIGAFTIIEKGAIIGDNVQIDGQCFIGAYAKVGTQSKIYAGSRIYAKCLIGSACIIHSNTIIGSDGFGFAKLKDGTYKKIPQVGIVRIEDRVEIGAGCTIDRATMDETIIMEGAKLDNLIHIAHNVIIGKNTVIAAQAGIAGSAKIGNDCMIGGQVGIAGHIEIADGTLFQAKSGMSKSVKKTGTKWYGYPAIEYNNYLRSYAVFRNLPQLNKKLNQLEKTVNNLDGKSQT